MTGSLEFVLISPDLVLDVCTSGYQTTVHSVCVNDFDCSRLENVQLMNFDSVCMVVSHLILICSFIGYHFCLEDIFRIFNILSSDFITEMYGGVVHKGILMTAHNTWFCGIIKKIFYKYP